MKQKTPDQVRAEFERKGMTFSQWAKDNGFKYTDVIGLMNGKCKGRRGSAHRIAVALGLKAGEVV